MALLLRNNEIRVIDYNLNELSNRQKLAVKSCIKSETVKIVKVFICLNGAAVSGTTNIPPSLAGFFVMFTNTRVFRYLQLVRNEIQERHQRVNETSLADFDESMRRITELRNFWYHMIYNLDEEREISVEQFDAMSFDQIKDIFADMELYTIDNYHEYRGPSWFQWYKVLDQKFKDLVVTLNNERDSYKQSWGWYILSFLNPFSYVYNVTAGFQSYASIAKNHERFKNEIVLPKRSMIVTRYEDIKMANQEFNNLFILMQREREALTDPTKCVNQPKNNYNTEVFKKEADRLLAIITTRIGRISLGNETVMN